jgi:hypothetical protein
VNAKIAEIEEACVGAQREEEKEQSWNYERSFRELVKRWNDADSDEWDVTGRWAISCPAIDRELKDRGT